MPAKTRAQRRAAEAAHDDAPEPPFYVATGTLWFGGPGSMPVADARPGDRVTPETLAAGPPEWGALVKVPEQYMEVLPPPPQDEPAGEAGTKEE